MSTRLRERSIDFWSAILPRMFKPLTICLAVLLFLPVTMDSREAKRERSSIRPQGFPKCADAKVQYTPFDAAYSKRIIFKSVSGSENPPASARKEYSPDRSMWMAALEPDTSKPGPWNSSFYFGSDADEGVWKLTFVDRRDADVKCLNDKLVFGQIWWGRVYLTEFILDLQQHKFIYREMAHYDAVTEPCQ